MNFIIDVRLDDKAKTLDGFEKITYINNSPDTLAFIWFHVWPNAYKHDKTAFSNQQLENGNTNFYFSDKEQRGYINRMDFKVNGNSAKVEDHPEHIDIIKLLLPSPLLPGQQITITTPFHVKLPYNFSRSGFDNGSFNITQWYPKPAVYDANGWHPMPYLDQGEFYSEFGDYEVKITVPKDYVVAATGKLQNDEELSWMKEKSSNEGVQSLAVVEQKKKVKSVTKRSSSSSNREKNNLVEPAVNQLMINETKTLHYVQNNIHDFGWFANKDFIVEYDTCRLTSGKVIDVFAYYNKSEEHHWRSNVISYSKDALKTRSNWIGDYPYDVVSIVQGGGDFSGGMEYPTITVVSAFDNPKLLDEVVAHEIGHNWFYGAIASNERKHPWMDEGLNTYYDFRYHNWKYGKEGQIEIGKNSVNLQQLQDILLETQVLKKKDQPIETPAEDFSSINYLLIAYHKTAQWLTELEKEVGTEAFDKAMQAYYQQWKFKHPYSQDFKRAIEVSTGKDLSSNFDLLHQTGLVTSEHKPNFKLASPLKLKTITDYIKQPTHNLITVSPAIGINSYDKLMIGGLITNYKLPPNRFQFLATPLYATGSKQLNGLGKINYTVHPGKVLQTAKLFLNVSTFSMNEFVDSAGIKTTARIQKLVPGIRIQFKESSRSTVRITIQWKTYLMNEEMFRFFVDTNITGTDTSFIQRITKPNNRSATHQLQFEFANNRALYPYRFQLQIEKGEDFLRPVLTSNYFFNYAKAGGLHLRFFAGKFIYTSGKTFIKEAELQRYHLNMTGANGYEDYTYSDYFIGRNKFEGFASQQIMIRDGGFKVRTDQLSSKVGKTDNWLIAANINTSIPSKFNPLSVLPIKIPLRIFADFGTYAEAWERDANVDRILFDAGLHLPLFNEVVNIYIPVVYSKVYGDYFKSTIIEKRLLKTISFSIDLNNSIKRITNELDL